MVHRYSLLVFVAGLALILTIPLLTDEFDNILILAMFIAGWLLIVVTAPVLALARPLSEWKRNRWRFSLGALLIGMTVLAIMLGLAASMSRMAD
ncbi:MAG: hypothetical protein L0228_03615 [Planctomycetes bacterium]|nr:hypothetical protein [Planctomycetota bacterium]